MLKGKSTSLNTDVSNACILQKSCDSAPWGHRHTLRWVAEFGVGVGLDSAFGGTDFQRGSGGSPAENFELHFLHSGEFLFNNLCLF